jgi:hypothetical protein
MKKLVYVETIVGNMINLFMRENTLNELEGSGKNLKNEIYHIKTTRKDGKIIIELEKDRKK